MSKYIVGSLSWVTSGNSQRVTCMQGLWTTNLDEENQVFLTAEKKRNLLLGISMQSVKKREIENENAIPINLSVIYTQTTYKGEGTRPRIWYTWGLLITETLRYDFSGTQMCFVRWTEFFICKKKMGSQEWSGRVRVGTWEEVWI